MERNTKLYGGVVFSQKVMLKLTEKGLSREEAYEIVQKNALKAIDENGDFEQNLLIDERVTSKLTPAEIAECFDVSTYLKM